MVAAADEGKVEGSQRAHRCLCFCRPSTHSAQREEALRTARTPSVATPSALSLGASLQAWPRHLL